jgi:sodium/pantothenate symporter
MTADEPITGIFVSVIALYLAGLALLTWVSYRKTDSVKEFLAMGGTAGSFLTGFAYFATQFSMSSLVGVPGTLYFVGVAGLGIILPVAMLSMAFGTLVAGRRLNALSHSLELWTLPDYLASRFNSNAIRLLAALMIIVFLIPYIAAQLVGAGVIFNVFTGGSYSLGVVIMGTVVVAYCMLGGMRAAVLTDALQAVAGSGWLRPGGLPTKAPASFWSISMRGRSSAPARLWPATADASTSSSATLPDMQPFRRPRGVSWTGAASSRYS